MKPEPRNAGIGRRHPAIATALALGVASLAGCGGGGGGMVRSSAPPPAAPTPAPAAWTWAAPTGQQPTPPAAVTPLPTGSVAPAYNTTGNVYLEGPSEPPVSGVSTAGSFAFDGWWGGFSPLLQGWSSTSSSGDVPGANRFDGGIFTGNNTLRVQGDLFGNVTIDGVATSGALTVTGTLDLQDLADDGIRGDTTIHGSVFNNGGILYVHGGEYASGAVHGAYRAYVTGDYHQTAAGTLMVQYGTPLIVGGQAVIEGGTLSLRDVREYASFIDGASGYERILYAFGGVDGHFDSVVAPSLLLEGSVEYGTNEILYRLTRVTAQSAMAAAGAGPLTMAGASQVDAAFRVADGLAARSPGSLTLSQQQLLASAGRLQRLYDVDQAEASFDSLSGQSFASSRSQLLDSFGGYGPTSSQLRQWRQESMANSAWATPDIQANAGGTGLLQGRVSEAGGMTGTSHRLGPQSLVGVAGGNGDAWMDFDRGGGRVHARQSLAMLYGHAWRGPWYAYGEVQGGHGRMDSVRWIDLGDGRVHQAVAGFDANLLRARLEGGFDKSLAGGRLTPFAGLRYDAIHSAAFAEAGDTGFELAGQAADTRRLDTEVGLRYGRDWRWGDGWLRLDAVGARRHVLGVDGDSLAAAFAGAPEAVFRIDAAQARDASSFDLQLQAGRGAGWSGALHYRWNAGDSVVDRGWWLGLERSL